MKFPDSVPGSLLILQTFILLIFAVDSSTEFILLTLLRKGQFACLLFDSAANDTSA